MTSGRVFGDAEYYYKECGCSSVRQSSDDKSVFVTAALVAGKPEIIGKGSVLLKKIKSTRGS